MRDRISDIGNIPSLGIIICEQSSNYSLGVSCDSDVKNYNCLESRIVDSISNISYNFAVNSS